MWPTGYVPPWRAADGSHAAPIAPATTTLKSVIAHLAALIRCAGIIYIVVQVAIWHSFYTSAAWRLAGPILAVAWAVATIAYLRRRWPSPFFACMDSAVYLVLALGAQECVPPAVRDDAFSWLVISMSGQLMVPAWYAPGALSLLLTLSSPASYLTGAMLPPVTNARTLAGAAVLLTIVGLVHGYGRRQLYRRAATADADLALADQSAREQYAVLCRNIERREHERLVHDTVLNTLTALARADYDDAPEALARCRQDVTLIESALGDPDALAEGAGRPARDLPSEVQAVVADMRARGLTVHVELEAATGLTVPARVITAISNATREALSNVAKHAGTGEAWVQVHLWSDGAEVPCRVQVVVRDRGTGFDQARVDKTRLGLRRSIAERIADCGGQASVWSRPGRGTVVTLSWPASEQSTSGQSTSEHPGSEPPGEAYPTRHTLAQETVPW
jgi:signal transduction histidine kinase